MLKCPRCNKWRPICDLQLDGTLPIDCGNIKCSWAMIGDLHDLGDWSVNERPEPNQK
jgi:hypothetical protein